MSTKLATRMLRTPCTHCPFRSDIPKYLTEDRARGIANSLRHGGSFPCHKTTELVEDDEGNEDLVETSRSKFCAGAAITMEKEGFSNQMIRVLERINHSDPTLLDMDAPVYASLTDWVRSYAPDVPTVTTKDGEVLPYEHCGVVGDDCVDPAGYGFGGGAVENDEEPTCNPLTDECCACGNLMCSECRSDRTEDGHALCVNCAEDYDDEDED
jgi:hypothetical protein